VTKSRSAGTSSQKLLLQYTGMAAKFLAVIGLLAYLGLRADRMVGIPFPILVWLLPLAGIVGLVVKAIVDTDKKRK
jgi:hypothetical protein